MVLAWENLQEVFVMLVVVVVVVVVLPHWRFFIHCFSTSSLTLQWVIARFLHPFYTFSPVLRKVVGDTSIWTFLGFYVTVLPRALQFWAGVFYLALVPQILARFSDSDASRNTPSRILLCACPHWVVPSDSRMVLNNSYCR